MSDKLFNFLNKYYKFSKKYVPLITLGIFLILLFCKLDNVILFSVYFGLLLAHMAILALISYVVKKHLEKVILSDNELKGVVNDYTKEDN